MLGFPLCTADDPVDPFRAGRCLLRGVVAVCEDEGSLSLHPDAGVGPRASWAIDEVPFFSKSSVFNTVNK